MFPCHLASCNRWNSGNTSGIFKRTHKRWLVHRSCSRQGLSDTVFFSLLESRRRHNCTVCLIKGATRFSKVSHLPCRLDRPWNWCARDSLLSLRFALHCVVAGHFSYSCHSYPPHPLATFTFLLVASLEVRELFLLSSRKQAFRSPRI